jgi:Acetyltransferases, including N-acetylases of ribosomal proteins
VEWVCSYIEGLAVRPPAQAIGLSRNGYIDAGVLFEDYNGASVVCHMAAMGRLNREFLWTVCDYAFRTMGVHKIIAPVFSDNVRMMLMICKMGFELEAVLYGCQKNGDIELFTMTAENCRFLGEKYNGQARRPTADARL